LPKNIKSKIKDKEGPVPELLHMGEEGIEEGQLGMSMWMLDGYAEVIAAISSECSSE